ncbi:uncharacterized protein LOC141908915 [Tubulanus polymorphus]|uniref:uncharacterized protein LOC141908915 n=1 Tax=Tubulanus polymorphus TaxID=672921 RepID=UPI003DA4F6D4
MNHRITTSIFPIICLLIVKESSGSTVESGLETAKIDDLITKFWDWRLKESPEFGTKYGLHDRDSEVEEFTLLAFDRRKKQADSFLKTALTIDDTKLDSKRATSLAILTDLLQTFLMGYQFREYGAMNPWNSMDTPLSDWSSLISWMKFRNMDDYQKLIKRLRKLPQQLSEIKRFWQIAIRRATTNHVSAMTGVQQKLERILNTNAEDSFFYKPFRDIPNTISAANRSYLQSVGLRTINEEVRPAIRDIYNTYLQDYSLKLRTDIAVSSLPDGIAYYKACLKWHLSVDLTPEQLHVKGQQEIKNIESKISKMMLEDGFTGSISEYKNLLLSKPENFYRTKSQLIEGYRKIIKNVQQKLGKVFWKKTTVPIRVEINPNNNGPTGRYSEPPLDGSRPGIFKANVYQPNRRPKFNMVALALHESEPGHHSQTSFAIQNSLPLFRRLIEYRKYYAVPFNWPFQTTYTEGWAMYAETLGNELGMYDTVPYSRFGLYSSMLHRAARLVVDTGIHAQGWSREQGVEYLRNYTTLPQSQIENEINRYIAWPGQACAYIIGKMKIMELREKAEAILGEDFDIRDFHEQIMNVGPAPLNVVDAYINNWLKKSRINTAAASHSKTVQLSAGVSVITVTFVFSIVFN